MKNNLNPHLPTSPANSIPKNAEKGACFVRCCTHLDKAYEYLIRFVDGEAIIGAKRPVSMNFDSSSSSISNSQLSGNFKLINGITWQCLHCDSNGILGCHRCHQWSCDNNSKDPKPCPHCSAIRTGRRTTTEISATEKQSSVKAIGHQREKLLSSTKKLSKL